MESDATRYGDGPPCAGGVLAELRVRSMAGNILLSVPKYAAGSLRGLDLKRVVGASIAYGITEKRLQLILGERAVEDDEVFETLWPQDGGHIELQLRIRRTREDEIEQEVLILLHQSDSSDLTSVLESLASIEFCSALEFEIVVKVIFSRALADVASSGFYAEVASGLKLRYPEFPPEIEGGRPITFCRLLLTHCQDKFESFTFMEDSAKDEECLQPSAGDLQLALMKFIGNLFVRELLAVRVIGTILQVLIGIPRDDPPIEHMIVCTCDLLRVIGSKLDSTPNGKVQLRMFISRLSDLRRESSEHIFFRIQDVLNLHNNGWQQP